MINHIINNAIYVLSSMYWFKQLYVGKEDFTKMMSNKIKEIKDMQYFDSIPVTERYSHPKLIKIKELNIPVALEHIIMLGVYTSFKPRAALINENRITLGYTIEVIDNLFDVKSCGPTKAIEIIRLYNNLNIDTTKWEKALSKHELHILNKKRAESVDRI